jgi:hypothetical protein
MSEIQTRAEGPLGNLIDIDFGPDRGKTSCILVHFAQKLSIPKNCPCKNESHDKPWGFGISCPILRCDISIYVVLPEKLPAPTVWAKNPASIFPEFV